ncbi:MAG TPA: hypothetical protein VM077_03570 [Candidatus Limnocylindrales bacterium]|nr:hypothetical protein [Candidatus Limnocylindrales bacterium]
MQRHEAAVPIPEQELAKQTTTRLSRLAKRSGFTFVIDPNGLAIPSHVSKERISLYRNTEGGVVVSAVCNEPVGPSLYDGHIVFTPVIPDPFVDDKYIRGGAGKRFIWFGDGKQKTLFLPEGAQDYERDYDIEYPERPSTDLVMAATDEPRPLVVGSNDSDEDPRSAAGFLDDELINAQINAAIYKHWDELILGPLRSRTPKEVEESRVRLLELNLLLDNIDMERDLIMPTN